MTNKELKTLRDLLRRYMNEHIDGNTIDGDRQQHHCCIACRYISNFYKKNKLNLSSTQAKDLKEVMRKLQRINGLREYKQFSYNVKPVSHMRFYLDDEKYDTLVWYDALMVRGMEKGRLYEVSELDEII